MERSNRVRTYRLREVSLILLTAAATLLFLGSGSLLDWTKNLEFGPARDWAVAATAAPHRVASATGLDTPARALQQAAYWLGVQEPEPGFDTLPAAGTDTTSAPEFAAADATECYTPQRKLRILLIGDSLMGWGIGTMLLRAITADSLLYGTQKYKVSSGLSRPDFYDWLAEARSLLPPDHSDTNHYGAVVVLIGANDAQNIRWHGRVRVVGSDTWNIAYRSRVDSFCELLTHRTHRVYWIGLPLMRKGGYNRRMQALNAIYESVCTTYRNVTFIPTVPLLADSAGNYSSYQLRGNRRTLIRADDGIHVTCAGGLPVADELLRHIRDDFFPPKTEFLPSPEVGNLDSLLRYLLDHPDGTLSPD
jgi:hypothetical protein